MELTDKMEHQDHQALTELMELTDKMEHQDHQVLMELMELTDKTEYPVQMLQIIGQNLEVMFIDLQATLVLE